MTEYLKQYGIYTIEQLRQAIESMEKIDLSKFGVKR